MCADGCELAIGRILARELVLIVERTSVFFCLV